MEKDIQQYLLSSALSAVTLASQNIMKIYNSGIGYNVNLKSDNTLIIEADKVSHETMRKMLSKTRIPLMSEEGRNILFEERYGWDLYWLVDPIDGTLEFVNKNNEFSICCALMEENRPAIGVISAPVFGQIYYAVKGQGTYRIDGVDFNEDIQYDIDSMMVSATQVECCKEFPGDELRVLTTLSNPNVDTENIISDLARRYKKVNRMRYGSALKFCRMAEGMAHLYFRTTSLRDWDTAAGELIAKESGLKVNTLSGGEIAYNKQELIIEPFVVSHHDILSGR